MQTVMQGDRPVAYSEREFFLSCLFTVFSATHPFK